LQLSVCLNAYIICLEIREHDLHNLCLLEVEELFILNSTSLKDYNCLPQLDLSNSMKL